MESSSVRVSVCEDLHVLRKMGFDFSCPKWDWVPDGGLRLPSPSQERSMQDPAVMARFEALEGVLGVRPRHVLLRVPSNDAFFVSG